MSYDRCRFDGLLSFLDGGEVVRTLRSACFGNAFRLLFGIVDDAFHYAVAVRLTQTVPVIHYVEHAAYVAVRIAFGGVVHVRIVYVQYGAQLFAYLSKKGCNLRLENGLPESFLGLLGIFFYGRLVSFHSHTSFGKVGQGSV